MSASNCSFQTCIQVSQETGKVVWYSHNFNNFPQFVVIHTVKDFSIVNKEEVNVFLEFPCFLHDPMNVGSLISDSSATLKPSLYIWKFSIYIPLKPSLKNLGHNLNSMWNEHKCMAVWTFFAISILWDWKENWLFPILLTLLAFQICWDTECNTLTASSFRILNSSAGIPFSPLALFILMLLKPRLTSHFRISGSRWVPHHYDYPSH